MKIPIRLPLLFAETRKTERCAKSQRLSLKAFAATFVLLGASVLAFAHPMGNYSVSHYSRIDTAPGGVTLRYALDLAEIPTFELLRDWGLEPASPKAGLEAKASDQMRVWAKGLDVTSAGKRIAPALRSASITLSEGAGSMSVARVTGEFALPGAKGELQFEDKNFPDRAGWKEIVIGGSNLIKASHGDVEVSKALTAYPEDPTKAPPQDLRASVEWNVPVTVPPTPVIEPIAQPRTAPAQIVSPGAQPATAAVISKGDRVSQMLRAGNFTPMTLLTLFGLVFVLGAAHALEPGHGKTMVAAYLVGDRGTMTHAMILGASVTFTHTISVFLLGFATLFLAKYIVPDKLFTILGVISGASIVFIGLSMLIKRIQRLGGHAHGHHDHDHDHAHVHEHTHAHAGGHSHDHDHDHDHGHSHGPDGHTHAIEGDVTVGNIIALGASGGLVPCPMALVILLSAISLGHVALGMGLLVAFSLGLALVLMAIGATVLYAKKMLPESSRKPSSPIFRYLPIVSAAMIVFIGVVMTATAAGWMQPLRFIG